jgi:hypothetical protein
MVDIIVPHVMNYEIAKSALESGKHVLVEKPITVLSSQGEELIALAKQKGSKFRVAENTHFVEAGQYMAYNEFSTCLSGALGSFIFGVILVTMNKTKFVLLLINSAILFLVGGIVFALKVPQKALVSSIKGRR